MEILKLARQKNGLSQRVLARRAGISFKGLQLMEQQDHDLKMSTLKKLAVALGLPGTGPGNVLTRYFTLNPDSVESTSWKILESGPGSWRIHLMDFVDAFRRSREVALIESAPVDALDHEYRCLITSTVERLCSEIHCEIPHWCAGIDGLKKPWFVSGMENLKAAALQESPAVFRKRNIFVLGNLLDRT